MSAPANGEWTVETLKIHMEALRAAQERFETERDRRYAEVGAEREKAMRIKEVADKAALELAREIQQYKDEKANELRAQIGSERGLYPTKSELKAEVDGLRKEITAATTTLNESIKPLLVYYNAQQGGPKALTAPMLIAAFGLVLTLLSIAGVLVALLNR